MPEITDLYCSETKTFATIERRAEPVIAGLPGAKSIFYRIRAVGTIEMRGDEWYFVGTGEQVCAGFSRFGHTLQGDIGQVEIRGEKWYFVGSGEEVLDGVLHFGHTLQGEGAPERQADCVYASTRYFDEACMRMTQETVASHLAQQLQAVV